jgi:hypothetical protein
LEVRVYLMNFINFGKITISNFGSLIGLDPL